MDSRTDKLKERIEVDPLTGVGLKELSLVRQEVFHKSRIWSDH